MKIYTKHYSANLFKYFPKKVHFQDVYDSTFSNGYEDKQRVLTPQAAKQIMELFF